MFQLDDKQMQQLAAWCEEQDKVVIERQRLSMDPKEFAHLTMDGQYAYYGAIGGSLTYSFTPTSIGVIIVVQHSGTQEKIDITNYDEF